METPDLNFIEDLTPARSFWSMKCKIIKIWKQSYRWDLILLDSKGNKIQGCVKIQLVCDFEPFLKEDAVYVIRNFGVAAQRDRLRVIPLDIKVNFFRSTTLTPVSTFEGHPFGFNFKDYSQVINSLPFNDLTVDLIVKLAWCGDLALFRSGDRDCKRISFDLQDCHGLVMKCNFWDAYAEELNRFVSTNSSSEMVIVVIQHACVKLWSEVNTVQNDRYATRVFINEELLEINNIRRSLILRDESSASQTVLSSQTVYPLHTEFLQPHERKHIDELLEVSEEMNCVVVATIKIIEEGDGWFYNACRTCHRKVVNKSVFLEQARDIPENFLDAPPDSLSCLKCNILAPSLIAKFKLHIRVQDSTGSVCVCLVMFDSEVKRLLGLKASDVRERQINSNDQDSFPTDFNVLQDRVFSFKISVSSYNITKKYHSYTIRKLTDDPDLLAELHANDLGDEDAREPSSVNVGDYSLPALDSKDALSYTDDSLAHVETKDTADSPLGKRRIVLLGDDHNVGQCSTTKGVCRKLEQQEDVVNG